VNPVAVDPCRDAHWERLVEVRAGGLFHAPPWLRAIEATYGFPLRGEVLLTAAGAPRSGLAFAELDDLFGKRIVSAPFCDACDPLIASAADWSQLSTRLVARRLPVMMRCLADRFAPADPSFQVVKRARWHRLDVSPPEERLWGALDASTRQAVRKATRSGVEVRRLEGREGARAFHGLHVALRKTKYRLLAQPAAFFENLVDQFTPGDGWHALGAWHQGELVAGAVFLRWGEVLYYKFGASRTDHLAPRPNTLLMWQAVLQARSLGCRSLDLGPSDDDQPGLIRFKRQFGAAESEVKYLRHDPPGWDHASGTAWRSRIGELTSLLTREDVPDDVTLQAGALLYRLFA